MTERAKKILEGKRERALKALEDESRQKILSDCVVLRKEEAKVILEWIKEATDDRLL